MKKLLSKSNTLLDLYDRMDQCNGDCKHCKPDLKEFCEEEHYDPYYSGDIEEW